VYLLLYAKQQLLLCVGDFVVWGDFVGWPVVGGGVVGSNVGEDVVGANVGEDVVGALVVVVVVGACVAEVMPLLHDDGELHQPLLIAFEHVEEEQYSQQYVSHEALGQPEHKPSWQFCLSSGQFEQLSADIYG